MPQPEARPEGLAARGKRRVVARSTDRRCAIGNVDKTRQRAADPICVNRESAHGAACPMRRDMQPLTHCHQNNTIYAFCILGFFLVGPNKFHVINHLAMAGHEQQINPICTTHRLHRADEYFLRSP